MDKIIDFFKTPEGFTGLIIFVFFLTLYIIAYKKSQKDEIVILNGNKDYITLIICLLSIPISIFLPIEGVAKLIIGILIFILSIILTVYYSIISNNGNLKNILISISAKLFILMIFILVFLLKVIEVIHASAKENQDRRYKDGTKGNLLIAAHNRNRRYTDRFIKNLIK